MVSLNKPANNTKDWDVPLRQNAIQIEAELNKGDRLYGPFYCHSTNPDSMVVEVDGGHIWQAGTLVETVQQSTDTLTPPSGTDQRIDRVVIDAKDGGVSVVTGTPSPDPAPPTIPSGKMPCARVTLFSGQTEIADTDIDDERTFASGSKLDDLERNLSVSAAEINDAVGLVGRVIMYGGSDEPNGWLLCNGQAVSRSTYSALFAVIGTTFGNGNGNSTFNVPDMRDRSPLGVRSMGRGDASRVDNYSTSRGDTGGEDQHKLTPAEMPEHRHDVNIDLRGGEDATTNDPAGGDSGVAGRHDSKTTSTGGDQAHNNMHPFLAVPFLIKT